MKEMIASSPATTHTAITVATRNSDMRNGSVWPRPPIAVIAPVTEPRTTGLPRPVSAPSSDSASANAMEMPAPTDAAIPTKNVCHVLWVANAAATGKSWLDILQHEGTLRGFILHTHSIGLPV